MPASTLLRVFAGPVLPVPLPPELTSRLRSVVVSERENDRSGFTLTFDAGRSGPGAALDTPVLQRAPITPFARVSVVVTFGAVSRVLVDGIVTSVDFTPGAETAATTLTVIGEDVSYLLDREEVDTDHPGLDHYQQVHAILARYAVDGIAADVVPPRTADPPLPVERVPTQHGTDLAHLTALARQHGYVAHVRPGPVPGTSTFYWGPVRPGAPQRALTAGSGSEANVRSLRFRTDALSVVAVDGDLQEPRSGTRLPLAAAVSTRPPLAARPLWAAHQGSIRRRRIRLSGVSPVAGLSRAQAEVDRGVDAVTAEGELDGARYGDVLRPRAVVGVRGAGWSHDGLWYVRRVDHELGPGFYTQRFTLARDGYGSLAPGVRP
ncbi:hypothetical protein ABZ793_22965 [Micromonospora sp. NPDC047465]|uniref:hypothetical protein n=1 Tax=Micromonospora sp. NPDC047465 TaxID=3154813 RepID=UPI003402DCD9